VSGIFGESRAKIQLGQCCSQADGLCDCRLSLLRKQRNAGRRPKRRDAAPTDYFKKWRDVAMLNMRIYSRRARRVQGDFWASGRNGWERSGILRKEISILSFPFLRLWAGVILGGSAEHRTRAEAYVAIGHRGAQVIQIVFAQERALKV
jgi:hypothetical protein